MFIRAIIKLLMGTKIIDQNHIKAEGKTTLILIKQKVSKCSVLTKNKFKLRISLIIKT